MVLFRRSMDIFSHGLWAGAAAKEVNLSPRLHTQVKRRLSIPLTMFWGVFPDLFAFTIPFLWIIYQVIAGGSSFEDLRPPQEPAQTDTLPVFKIAHSLYNISHSVPLFLLFFGIIYLILKRPVWEMTGALIHILSDIPTHSYSFYPTPFLWPLSDFKVNGFSWGTPWFMVLDISLLILVYALLHRKEKLSQNVSQGH